MSGRPPFQFDQAIADRICELLATTSKGLAAILEYLTDNKEFDKVPSTATVYKWLESTPSFAESSARARLLQADTLADLAMKVAETPIVGTTTQDMEWGVSTKTSDNVQRSQLIVQTILKRIGQLNNKKYGEKLDMNVTGELSLAERVQKAREKAANDTD